MSKGKLTNYLRAYRKRAGLTQREVAFLLGTKARGPVSEIEKRHRAPLLRRALALSSTFGTPVEELFAGMREAIASKTHARLERLACELTPKVGINRYEYQTARKLAGLRARCGSVAFREPESPASPRP